MKAVVLHGINDIRLEDVPVPAVPPGHVLIRIGFCGICGSDIPRIFTKGTYRFPTICGHEFSGTVESCGKGAESFSPGTRVGVFPLLWCGNCEACETETYAQCRDYDYLGSRSNGAFASYVAAPVRNLIRLPDSVSLEEAAMLEPAAVAHHALAQAGGCGPQDSVAIWGAGPIGLMVAMFARAGRARRILLLDVDRTKLDLARSLGFADVCDLREQQAEEWIQEKMEGRQPDITVDAAGVPSTLLAAMTCAAPGGRVVWLGNPSGDVTFPAALISKCMRRELRMYGTWNSSYHIRDTNDDWHAALKAIEAGDIDLKPLITRRVPLGEAVDVLRRMRDRSLPYVKILIQPEN